ncbi:MAG: hypothetical protein ACFFD2_02735 [Promethearchaeota archaeon]
MNEPPIERLLREKRDDAIEIYDYNILEFLSPDRNSSSKLIVDKFTKKLYVETKLYHSTRMIDENIYLASNVLSENYTENQIRQIIDDISARLRQIELPKKLQNVPFNYQIVDQDKEYTKFSYTLSYEEISSYEKLRAEFETILMNSFELIYGYLMKMRFFIQAALNQFLIQPKIELKLLEIRSLLFRAKFYTAMTGRFASDQKRIAQSMRKDALKLIAQFKEEYPDIASERLQEIYEFFEI